MSTKGKGPRASDDNPESSDRQPWDNQPTVRRPSEAPGPPQPALPDSQRQPWDDEVPVQVLPEPAEKP